MSLFSKSSGNRRVKRGGAKRSPNLLEVSTRPEKEGFKEIRRRVYAVFRVGLILSGVGALVFLGKTGLRRLFWENPVYAVSDLRVSTDGMLTRAQVLELLELEEGRNIFSVDVERMRATLEGLPQVDRAEVRRMLPDRVEVRIVERQPVAWVAATAEAELGVKGQALLVNGRGYALQTRKVLPEYLSLPMIVGVNMEDIAPGQKLPNAELLAAVELIRLSAGDGRWLPRIVDVSKGYCLMVTDQRKARVTFGFENLEEQLNRLGQLLETVEPMQRDLQTVNLMLERNIPVTFAPAPVPVNPPGEGKAKGKNASPAKVGANAAPASNAVTADQIAKAQAAAASAAAAQAAAAVSTGGGVAGNSPSGVKVERVAGAGMGQSGSRVPREVSSGSAPRENAGGPKLESLNAGTSASGALGAPKDRGLEREGVVVNGGSGSVEGIKTVGSEAEPVGLGGGRVAAGDGRIQSAKLSGGEVGSSEQRAVGVTSIGGGGPEARNSAVVAGGVKKAESHGSREEAPPRAVPVKPRASVPEGGSASSMVPASPAHGRPDSSKRELPKPDLLKPETPAPKSAPLIPNERLRKMFQPHA
jgi:cell division septal protein FtsQ